MGASQSINKINYEDMQYGIQNKCIIINTLPIQEQECLISGTVKGENETELINQLLKKSNYTVKIIIYGKNCNDDSPIKKYEQLVSLGFLNVYLYAGGIFEWLLMQDIYGEDEFPTTKKVLDILKFRPSKKIIINLLEYN